MTIPATDPGQSATPISAFMPIQISNADTENLKFVLNRIVPVPGRVVIEGRPLSNNDPDLGKIRVALTRDPDVVGMFGAGGSAPGGVVAANGEFSLPIFGENGGRFRMSVSGLPANTYVKAIRMGAMDILADGLQMSGHPENPFEITIGADAGAVHGVVADDKRSALPNAVVALVPEAPGLRHRFDLYKSVATDSSGRFQIQTVPPGDYKLFAWEYVVAGAWEDAEFLQNYEVFGKPIRISGGSTQEDIQLSAVPARR
jgi:carboxypeptidase family protein